MAPIRTLVYGFGNPGKEDDGLGIALADNLELERMPGVTVEKNYQLNIEDALTVAEHDLVVFVDASINDIDGFRFSALRPEPEVSFTTHAMSPGSILALCNRLYEKKPPAYLLEIKGLSWNMHEEISKEAQPNLNAASHFLKSILLSAQPIETAAARAA
jgi:hydrogenase maturation protease